MLFDISFVICLDFTNSSVEYIVLCFWDEKLCDDYFVGFAPDRQ
jgi:hypothetical protein